MKSLILCFAGAILLTACGATGTYYEKTPEQVAASLKAADLPLAVLGTHIKRSRVTQPDANTVVTALIGANGAEVMHFVTTVIPDGTGSRVSTEVRLLDEAKNKNLTGEAALALALMDGLAKEHVTAAIEGRPFDMTFAASPIAKGMMRNNPELQREIAQANASAADFARMQQDFASERSGSGWGEGDSEPAFGQPMDDARPDTN